MKTSFVFLLLSVVGVSCHNWYKGPRFFSLDVVQPRSGLGTGSGGTGKTFDSGPRMDPAGGPVIVPWGVPAIGSDDIGPRFDPVGGTGLNPGDIAHGEISNAGSVIVPWGVPAIGSDDTGPRFDPVGGTGLNPGDIDSIKLSPEAFSTSSQTLSHGEISNAGSVIVPWGVPAIGSDDIGPRFDPVGGTGLNPGDIDSIKLSPEAFSTSSQTLSHGGISNAGSVIVPWGVPAIGSDDIGSANGNDIGPVIDPNGAGGDTITNIGNVISVGPIIPDGSRVGTKVFVNDKARIDPLGGYYLSKSGGNLHYKNAGRDHYKVREGSGFYKIDGSLLPDKYVFGGYASASVPGTKNIKWLKGAEKFLHFYKTQHKKGFSSKYKSFY